MVSMQELAPNRYKFETSFSDNGVMVILPIRPRARGCVCHVSCIDMEAEFFEDVANTSLQAEAEKLRPNLRESILHFASGYCCCGGHELESK